jgi:hypothetical protein
MLLGIGGLVVFALLVALLPVLGPGGFLLGVLGLFLGTVAVKGLD